MEKKKSENKPTYKYLKLFLILLVTYWILGLPLGYVGLQLRCQHPLYSCPTIYEYLSDPWLASNAFFWPFSVVDGLSKANIF